MHTRIDSQGYTENQYTHRQHINTTHTPHIHMHTSTRMHKHVYIHTYMHTHIYTHRCTHRYQRWSEYNTNVLEYEYDYFEHA